MAARLLLQISQMSERLLLSAKKRAIFQLYHDKSKFIQWNDDDVHIVIDQHVDMSLHSDTLAWFRTNHSLLFLLNPTCSAEKQQIPILSFWFYPTGAWTQELPHSRLAC